jgi:hypothetical protein
MRTDIPVCLAFRRESIQVWPACQRHVAARLRVYENVVNHDWERFSVDQEPVGACARAGREVYNTLTMPR